MFLHFAVNRSSNHPEIPFLTGQLINNPLSWVIPILFAPLVIVLLVGISIFSIIESIIDKKKSIHYAELYTHNFTFNGKDIRIFMVDCINISHFQWEDKQQIQELIIKETSHKINYEKLDTPEETVQRLFDYLDSIKENSIN